MKSFMVNFLILLSGFTQAQTWTALQDFPGLGREEAVSFVIGDKLYVGSGKTGNISYSRDFYAFDFLTETWSPITSLKVGEERSGAISFTNGTFGYVYGGKWSANYLNNLKRYNPTTNTWKYMAPFPSNKRIYSASFVVNDEAFIVGGNLPSNAPYREVWKYSIPTDTWTQMNPPPFAGLEQAAACTLNGIGYLLGGRDSTGNYNNILYSYNASIDQWSIVDTFPGPGRGNFKMEPLGNNLIFFAGIDYINLSQSFDDLWMYDFSSQTFFQYNSIPSLPRYNYAGGSWNNNFYVSTGTVIPYARTKETWKVSLVVGVNDLNPDKITIYPNPFIDEIRINKEGEFFVTDLSGRRVEQGIIENNSINLKNLSYGVYILTIIDNKENMFASKITKLN